jgi:CHAD domain-containing protein
MIKALKGLQDVLGRHQDREVQMAMLGRLRGEVASMPGGPAALMAMGVLIERLEADAAAARSEFADAFLAFAATEQRRLVKRTFR